MSRIKYVDYSKAIGILVIVFAHCIQWFPVMEPVNAYVISFHVPIFFVVSGCLGFHRRLYLEEFRRFIRKRAKALLIPYLLFSIINSLIKVSVLLITSSLTKNAVFSELIELLITGNGTVWFLFTLFFIEMLAYVFKKIPVLHKKWIVFLLALAFLMIPYCFIAIQGNPFVAVILRIFAGFGYYLIGFGIISLLTDLNKMFVLFGSLFLFFAGTIESFFFPASFSFFEGRFLDPLPSITISIFCSVGIIVFLYAIEGLSHGCSNRLLNYFGRNSLAIMLIHPIILNCFTFLYLGFMRSTTGIQSVLVSLGLFVVIILICIPAVWLMNKYLPWMLGKSK